LRDKISQRWLDLFSLLPGYDPVATAAPGEWFDGAAADHAVDFFPECLRHIEGKFAGDPFFLAPWQQAVIGCLFGWKRETGHRRYREAMLGVPRGNGKTPLAAGICLYALFCDQEHGAQIYGAAADIPQAALLFRHAKGMVMREAELESRCKINESHKSIVSREDVNSAYRVVSSDAPGKHGYTPHLVICDELHAWHGTDLMEAFESAFAKAGREQPLLLHITTQDFDRPSVCNIKWEYAEKVRDGRNPDSAFLPILYHADEGDDWTQESTWEKANPNIDVSVDRVSLARMCRKALAEPSYENTFKRLHLNIRTQQDVRWLQLEKWDACDGAPLPDGPCYAGLDLASTTDIAALVLYFPESHSLAPYFWIPADRAEERERRDRVPYLTWARQGLIDMTPGNVIDYNHIRARVNELSGAYDIRQIGYDPWNARHLAQQLQDEDGLPMIEFRQGYVSMNEPTKHFERLLMSGDLRHGGNPVLRWMAGNATARTDPSGNIKPDKARSKEKIDGIVASVMAVGLAMVAEVETSRVPNMAAIW